MCDGGVEENRYEVFEGRGYANDTVLSFDSSLRTLACTEMSWYIHLLQLNAYLPEKRKQFRQWCLEADVLGAAHV
jgi:hypothetical protein